MYLLMNTSRRNRRADAHGILQDKARKALGISSGNGDSEEEIEKEIIGNRTNRRVNAGLLTYPTLVAVDILIHHRRLRAGRQRPGTAP